MQRRYEVPDTKRTSTWVGGRIRTWASMPQPLDHTCCFKELIHNFQHDNPCRCSVHSDACWPKKNCKDRIVLRVHIWTCHIWQVHWLDPTKEKWTAVMGSFTSAVPRNRSSDKRRSVERRMQQTLTRRWEFHTRPSAVVLVVAEMATVTQLTPRIWLVYFHEISGEVDFNCCFHNFKISTYPSKKLNLKVMKKGNGK